MSHWFFYLKKGNLNIQVSDSLSWIWNDSATIPYWKMHESNNQKKKNPRPHDGKYNVFVTSFLKQDKTVNMQPVNACWINLLRTK